LSEEIAVPDAAELAKADEELAAAAIAGIKKEDLRVPMIKVGQQLTAEVASGNAESGDFIYGLTGESYGNEIDFVIVHAYKGRLYSTDDQTYVADGDVAPDSWPDEFAGKPFADIPQAEEQHKAQANAGGKWGSGPEIQSTHNFIGFVVSDPGLPARLSLKGTSTRAAEKINTLISFTGKAPWANQVHLKTLLKTNTRDQPYYVVEATQGEQNDAATVAKAQELARQVQAAARIATAGSEDDDPKPKAKGKPKGGVDL